MSKQEIYILYGSQTGNAEFIAKDLHEKCQEKEIKSICTTLNDAKKINLKEVAKAVIILCSTTGNGDAPENADGWWRVNKLKSLVCYLSNVYTQCLHLYLFYLFTYIKI
jgi:methionine synthase reductase